MMKVPCEASALSCARLLLGAWSALICLSQGIRLHPLSRGQADSILRRCLLLKLTDGPSRHPAEQILPQNFYWIHLRRPSS